MVDINPFDGDGVDAQAAALALIALATGGKGAAVAGKAAKKFYKEQPVIGLYTLQKYLRGGGRDLNRFMKKFGGAYDDLNSPNAVARNQALNELLMDAGYIDTPVSTRLVERYDSRHYTGKKINKDLRVVGDSSDPFLAQQAGLLPGELNSRNKPIDIWERNVGTRRKPQYEYFGSDDVPDDYKITSKGNVYEKGFAPGPSVGLFERAKRVAAGKPLRHEEPYSQAQIDRLTLGQTVPSHKLETAVDLTNPKDVADLAVLNRDQIAENLTQSAYAQSLMDYNSIGGFRRLIPGLRQKEYLKGLRAQSDFRLNISEKTLKPYIDRLVKATGVSEQEALQRASHMYAMATQRSNDKGTIKRMNTAFDALEKKLKFDEDLLTPSGLKLGKQVENTLTNRMVEVGKSGVPMGNFSIQPEFAAFDVNAPDWLKGNDIIKTRLLGKGIGGLRDVLVMDTADLVAAYGITTSQAKQLKSLLGKVFNEMEAENAYATVLEGYNQALRGTDLEAALRKALGPERADYGLFDLQSALQKRQRDYGIRTADDLKKEVFSKKRAERNEKIRDIRESAKRTSKQKVNKVKGKIKSLTTSEKERQDALKQLAMERAEVEAARRAEYEAYLRNRYPYLSLREAERMDFLKASKLDRARRRRMFDEPDSSQLQLPGLEEPGRALPQPSPDPFGLTDGGMPF